MYMILYGGYVIQLLRNKVWFLELYILDVRFVKPVKEIKIHSCVILESCLKEGPEEILTLGEEIMLQLQQ